MKKQIAVLIILGMLASCSTTETVWRHDWKSDQEMEADLKECRREADLRLNYDNDIGIMTVRFWHFFTSCMEYKGYYRVTVDKIQNK